MANGNPVIIDQGSQMKVRWYDNRTVTFEGAEQQGANRFHNHSIDGFGDSMTVAIYYDGEAQDGPYLANAVSVHWSIPGLPGQPLMLKLKPTRLRCCVEHSAQPNIYTVHLAGGPSSRRFVHQLSKNGQPEQYSISKIIIPGQLPFVPPAEVSRVEIWCWNSARWVARANRRKRAPARRAR